MPANIGLLRKQLFSSFSMHFFLSLPDSFEKLIKFWEGYHLRSKLLQHKGRDMVLRVLIVGGFEHLFGEGLGIDHLNTLGIELRERRIYSLELQIANANSHGSHLFSVFDFLEEQLPKDALGLPAALVGLAIAALRDVLMQVLKQKVVEVDVAHQS
jgi:hypothetical protein